MLGEEASTTPIDEGQARQTDAIDEEAQVTSADEGGQEVKETQEVIVPVDQEATTRRLLGLKGIKGLMRLKR